MPLGYLCLVLHAHLPFVRHPEYDDFLEEDWLYEAITETYIPLLEAFDGLDPKCPEEIRKRQRLVTVKYYSTDGQVHQGQLVIDAGLVNDVKRVFALALKERFPVHSVIPISDL